MTEPDLRVAVKDADGTVLVTLAGAVDLATVPQLESELVAAIGNQTSGLTLDLSDVDYLDSAGLRVLFRLTTRMAELRIPMEVVAPLGTISRRVIDLSGYSEVGVLRR
jgi:anti-anti-sigma factor